MGTRSSTNVTWLEYRIRKLRRAIRRRTKELVKRLGQLNHCTKGKSVR